MITNRSQSSQIFSHVNPTLYSYITRMSVIFSIEGRLLNLTNKWLTTFGLLLALAVPPVLTGCTIVSIEELEAAEQSAEFDPVIFVDGVWENQVIPAVLSNAVDAPTVLSAIEDDLEAGGETYGLFVGGSYNFMISGQGEVTAVDTESRNGTMEVKLNDYQGPATLIVQIGPSIRGDALRDASGTIEFGQFKDQTEFGKVSRELNKRVAPDIIGDLDAASLVGKTVSFHGVFSISITNQTNIDLSTITVTPVELQVQ